MKREGVIELLRRKWATNLVSCSPDPRSDDEQA
jgi:hypothetical protein